MWPVPLQIAHFPSPWSGSFFGGVSMKAPISQWATSEAFDGKKQSSHVQRQRKSQSISGFGLRFMPRSSSSRNYFQPSSRERTALCGNKRAGVWRWHASSSSLFRHKGRFQMMGIAENVQLSNLWLYSTTDSWYHWTILVLFFWGFTTNGKMNTQLGQRVSSWVRNCYCRNITGVEILAAQTQTEKPNTEGLGCERQ